MEAHQQGEGSLAQLAVRFRVSLSWAKGISATLGRTGKMERPPAGPRGPKSKLTEEVRQQLREWIAAQPDLTLMEMQRRLDQELSLKVSIGRLWKVLREMGLRLKKSHSMPPNRTLKRSDAGARAGQEATRQIDPARLIFLDETGATTEMTRRYGRAISRRTGARRHAGGALADADGVGRDPSVGLGGDDDH